MSYTFQQLLDDVRSRQNFVGFGLSTADRYLKDISNCLTGGGHCPTKIFDLENGEVWAKALKEAADRLVYCDEKSCDPDFIQKSIRQGTDITKGAVLEYDTVLTSRRKDRDGDVIEPAGFVLDEKMPVLWHHMQMQPIGKMIGKVRHDKEIIVVKNALADTPLGRDAAALVSFGALRTSQGFKGGEFEPLEIKRNSQGQEYVAGWHFKTGTTVENSLVSVPANVDANILATYAKEFDGVCTAYSRGDLHTDAFKHWAKSLYDQRPVTVQSGIDLTTKNADSDASGKPADTEKNMGEGKEKCPKCELGHYNDQGKCPCGHCKGEKSLSVEEMVAKAVDKALAARELTKTPATTDDSKPSTSLELAVKSLGEGDAGELVTKMVGVDDHYLEGSYEWMRDKLSRGAKKFLEDNDVACDGYVNIGATFADRAIICCEKWTGNEYKTRCFSAGWAMKDGKPALSGIPTEVQIKPQIVAKMMADAREKHAVSPERIAATVISKACIDDRWVPAMDKIADFAEAQRAAQSATELAAVVGG